jgi:hypothetical protein
MNFGKFFLVLMGLSFVVCSYATTFSEQTIQDCTQLLDETRIKCMKENKKICETIEDDIKQDRCMKNLEGNPTKMM